MSNPFAAKPDGPRKIPEDAPPQAIGANEGDAKVPSHHQPGVFCEPTPEDAPPEAIVPVADKISTPESGDAEEEMDVPAGSTPEEIPPPLIEREGGDSEDVHGEVPPPLEIESFDDAGESAEVQTAALVSEVEAPVFANQPAQGVQVSEIERSSAFLSSENQPPPLSMEEVSCRTCRYFHFDTQSRANASEGECRCKAPTQSEGHYASWPKVVWEAWCGEWTMGVSDEEMIKMARAVADKISGESGRGFKDPEEGS